MKKILFITIILASSSILAQCPTILPTLSSQAEVDAFATSYPNCTELTSALTIQGNDIADLSALSVITNIDGLSIINCPNLMTLSGLESIVGIDGPNAFITIQNNDALQDISALINASSTDPIDLYIINNQALISLNGLQGLQDDGYSYTISNNSMITDLTGLNNIVNIDDLYIEGNGSLISLNGLDSLEIAGTFILINNALLTSLANLNDIETCGLIIQNNAVLENIDGFSTYYPQFCESNINITGNPNLNVCNTVFVCAVLDANLPNTINIENNVSGCNTPAEVETACSALVPSNDNCGGAELLTLGQTLSASSEFSTSSLITPSCNNNTISYRNDVWFTFNSETLTTVDINVTGDYALQLWTGTCDALTQVPDACALNTLSNIAVDSNTDYFLQVWFNTSASRVLAADFNVVVNDGLLSITDNFSESVKLLPNPADTFLIISSRQKMELISIHSILGNTVFQTIPNSIEEKIDVSGLKAGIYILKAKIGNQTISRKVIKE